MDDTFKPWSYSHTQLALWKLCQRQYYYKYILGKKQEKTPNMAAGTWLCQAPIEAYEETGRLAFESFDVEGVWKSFLSELGGIGVTSGSIFQKDLAKQILDAYMESPVPGRVVDVERRFFKVFSTGSSLDASLRYQSRPDFVVERRDEGELERVAWDIKLKTFNQSRVGDTFFVKPELSPFDDQGLGQAVCSGATHFGQIQFWLGKKDATLVGPIYVEQPVSAILAAEWVEETLSIMAEIEAHRDAVLVDKRYGSWPKNGQSCHAYGRECDFLANCRFGK